MHFLKTTLLLILCIFLYMRNAGNVNNSTSKCYNAYIYHTAVDLQYIPIFYSV